MVRRGKHRRRAAIPPWLVLAVIALGILTSVAPSRRATPAPSGTLGSDQVVAAAPGAPPTGSRSVQPAAAGGAATPPIPRTQSGWHVMVPVIAVDAPVMRLGLNADGTLQVPTVYSEAGWYDGGPKPGDVGPAVIVGHVDSQTGPAVFYRLHELQPGDRITVDMAGKRKTFVVQQIRRYPKDAFPTHLVYGPTEVPALRLITCGGSFDFVTGHYSDNIVVFANLAASPL